MSDYDRSDYGQGQKGWTGRLILFAVVFVAGMLSMGWILTRWDAATPFLSWVRPQPPTAITPTRLAPPQVAAPDSDVAARVVDLEERLDGIAARAAAASGNADRAEGLLVAFAARRAIDRGLQLGYIEDLLRNRFSRTQPQAVATIISTAHQPVTLDELRSDLEELAPDLSGAGENASWWDSVRRELASAIVIRRAELPSAIPEDRLNRARRHLETDQVDRALAEIARLPARDKATRWMAKARRYIAAHNALDLIETSALLMPGHEPAPAVNPPPRRDAR